MCGKIGASVLPNTNPGSNKPKKSKLHKKNKKRQSRKTHFRPIWQLISSSTHQKTTSPAHGAPQAVRQELSQSSPVLPRANALPEALRLIFWGCETAPAVLEMCRVLWLFHCFMLFKDASKLGIFSKNWLNGNKSKQQKQNKTFPTPNTQVQHHFFPPKLIGPSAPSHVSRNSKVLRPRREIGPTFGHSKPGHLALFFDFF